MFAPMKPAPPVTTMRMVSESSGRKVPQRVPSTEGSDANCRRSLDGESCREGGHRTRPRAGSTAVNSRLVLGAGIDEGTRGSNVASRPPPRRLCRLRSSARPIRGRPTDPSGPGRRRRPATNPRPRATSRQRRRRGALANRTSAGEYAAITRRASSTHGTAPVACLGRRRHGQVDDVLAAGRRLGGVPAVASVAAVVVNVTVTNAPGSSFLTVWPSGEAKPLGVEPQLRRRADGRESRDRQDRRQRKVSLYNHDAPADVVFDIVGFYSSPSGHTGGAVPRHATPTRNPRHTHRRRVEPGSRS